MSHIPMNPKDLVMRLGERTLAPIDSLRLHPQNPRQGDVEAARASIEKHGFLDPVLVQASTRFILDGNHRWKATKQLLYTHIPANIIDVDDVEALEILLIMNRTSDRASYDETVLMDVLGSVLEARGDIEATGWTDDEYENIVDSLRPPEFIEYDASSVRGEHVCPSCGYEWSEGEGCR